jgi:Flp pilus assembly protein TadG
MQPLGNKYRLNPCLCVSRRKQYLVAKFALLFDFQPLRVARERHRASAAAAMVRDRRGASAIEFAIVLPVFLLIVLGILTYGIYLGSVHSVEQLAADAARASVAGLSDGERVQIAKQHVTTNADGYPLLNASKIAVEAGPSPLDSSQFRVLVRFDASDLPIWVMSGIVPMPDRIIERTSVIKRGGY